MLKLLPHRQGTTEYIRLSELPANQANSLLDWLPETFLTKLDKEGVIAEDCIEYDDYEFWYEYTRRDTDSLDEQL